jgi:hypothetical protein
LLTLPNLSRRLLTADLDARHNREGDERGGGSVS